ncbi:MAG: C4-dicarboxylate ABC transporter permease, partial [Burkholderiaceae bacterium]
ITPPVGFNLFVLQGMTKKPLSYIARVAMPMFLLMILTVLIFYHFPETITWLPSKM